MTGIEKGDLMTRRIWASGLAGIVLMFALLISQEPQVVHAQTKVHMVTLNWTASVTSGITYNVCRASVAGGPYTVLRSGLTVTTYNDGNASAPNTYFYVVQAVDANGFLSSNSNEVTATPIANPAPPTGLTVTVQ